MLAGAIPEGERNATLTSIAGKLLASKLTTILAADLLARVNLARCKPPLGQREVEKIIVSLAKCDMRRGTR